MNKTDPRQNEKLGGIPLLQKSDAREVMLSRMREKLAAPSQFALAAEAKRGSVKRKNFWGWFWKLYVLGAVIALNAALFGFRNEITEHAKKRHAPALPKLSASLSPEQQALFWAYALYDFDKLKQTFGAPAGAVIDASMARLKLEELRSKVDARTRFIIDSYRPFGGGK